jgi:hypothetical protein
MHRLTTADMIVKTLQAPKDTRRIIMPGMSEARL